MIVLQIETWDQLLQTQSLLVDAVTITVDIISGNVKSLVGQ